MRRIGIDVGGTHTDAVLLEGDTILSTTKAMTTADVTSGVMNALHNVLTDANASADSIHAVMIGTTQFTNAVVERRHLSEVAAIRIALPGGRGLPSMTDWPEDIAEKVGRHTYALHGGYLYDGWPMAKMIDAEIEQVIDDIAHKGLSNIAIASAFSPMNAEPEELVAKRINERLGDVNITLSHELGSLGLLERENAAILNASLMPLADKVVSAFNEALAERGFGCPMFISQNDGTLMGADFVRQFPALTFSSGPTNSLRGASKLTGYKNAIVVDIGGTTSDIGVLQDGFPRTSSVVVKVGGIRTNFRMPDINAVGLGGGSIVSESGQNIGPQSVGHELLQKGKVFGGDVLTASDIAVAADFVEMGEPSKVSNLAPSIVENAVSKMHDMLDDNIEMMKPNSDPVPVILVGGGAVLVGRDLKAASKVIRPENAGLANAIGAAIAQIGGEAEGMMNYRELSREKAIQQVESEARARAVSAGAEEASLEVAEVEETAIPYMDDGMYQVKVKVVGNVAQLSTINKQEVAS